MHGVVAGIFVLFFFIETMGQNHISNFDFESYSSLPVGNGELNKAIGWADAVMSCDYMNTGYNCWVSDIGGAHSGTGYIGFASYGDANGSAEAAGQDISAKPLLPSQIYSIDVFIKMTNGTNYGSVCGGLELYGFANNPGAAVVGAHASSLSGAMLLWSSGTITTTTWKQYQDCFSPAAKINYIVITNEKTPNCRQYLFMDDLIISPPAGFSMLGNDTIVCENNELAIAMPATDYTYQWQDNSTTSTYTISEEGLYWVDITGACGTKRDSILISYTSCDPCIISVPNAFTPNDDATNEYFSPETECAYTGYTFMIFNRWGDKIFETNDPSRSWDGYVDGNLAPIGVYPYLLKYTIKGEAEEKKYGHVNLIR